MPGWLWVVIAIALGIVIYLLLRSRGGSGRHRAAPAVEYVPALESFERDDDETLGYGSGAGVALAGDHADEAGASGELRGAAHELKGAAGELRGAAETLRHDPETDTETDRDTDTETDTETDTATDREVDRKPGTEPDRHEDSVPEPVLTPEQEERAEQAEDAELRHDDGYVETIGDELPVDDAATAAETPVATGEPVVAEEPVAEEPVAEAPVAEEPVQAEPVANELVAEKPKAPEAPATGVDPSEYGAGSALPGPDGSGPRGWTVKGNADSMLYYTAEAHGFARAAADVWFESEDAASAAGFTRWDAHHR